MFKTVKTAGKNFASRVSASYKASKRTFHIGLMVVLGLVVLIYIYTKSKQEDVPTWVYVIFFLVMIGVFLRKLIPSVFPATSAKSAWDRCKNFFLHKNFLIAFWRIVLLIIFVPLLLVYLNIYFQKREIKYVDTNPPAAQVTTPTPRPSYSSIETMTYNAGERYFLNVPNEETVLDLIPLNTDEAYVTFYHANTNNVAMKLHIFRSGNRMITKPLYADGSDWPGQYDFVFDREFVIAR